MWHWYYILSSILFQKTVYCVLPLLLTLMVVSGRWTSNSYVAVWHECRRECISITLICEWPCRIYSQTRMDFKYCALECKLDRLVCMDECGRYVRRSPVRRRNTRNFQSNRRKNYATENEENEESSPKYNLYQYLLSSLES